MEVLVPLDGFVVIVGDVLQLRLLSQLSRTWIIIIGDVSTISSSFTVVMNLV